MRYTVPAGLSARYTQVPPAVESNARATSTRPLVPRSVARREGRRALSESACGAVAKPTAATLRYCSSSRVDRKSTRLNSSHSQISYAVFCLKKKKKQDQQDQL